MPQRPVFCDITLRDGNQSLKKPWNIKEKERIFDLIAALDIPVVEAGFAASSQMDFDTLRKICEKAPSSMKIASLARTVENDILRALDAIKPSKNSRIHTFIATSPFHMKYVLNKSPEQVKKIAVDAVKFIRDKAGKHTDIEFSAEHFGDCDDNLDFVIGVFKDVVKAGANVINLPNTVERTRIKNFLNMVEKVREELPEDVQISVHCHNDLGMATATTVESYFSGAVQLECCLNGLGERAGNTNFYEVAVALHNSGVETGIQLSKIYETALIVSEMSKTAIYDKAPLIGKEALAHRSGIHQDGALKTKDMDKGAYRPINPELIGRKDSETLGITSQSGKTAVFEVITEAGYPITIKEAERIAPVVKAAAEKIGELPTRNITDIYFAQVFNIKGAFALKSFEKYSNNSYRTIFSFNGKEYEKICEGNGPVDACMNALKECGFEQNLLDYEQKAVDGEIFGSGATAMTVMRFVDKNGNVIISRGMDKDTEKANVKAIFNGFNILYSEKSKKV